MTTNERSEPQLTEVTAAVRSLVDVMHANGLTKIDVSVGDVSIKLRAGTVKRPASKSHQAESLSLEPAEIVETAPVGFVIAAPMIGTYYSSPGPGEAPFVHIGDRIEPGQTIGIIEAMKIMNEIPADRGGIVIEILVSNAQAVEYGSPLLRLSDGAAGV